MKKRYPGPLPFSYDDRNLFFGREQEIDYLTTLIINNQVTILHGKSGYGKSSLINAGLIPNLLENFNCEIIRVRFYNYDKANPMMPLDTFLKTIEQHVSGKPYLDGLLKGEHASAWRYFKKLQHGILKKFPQDAEGATNTQQSYILVIDQFEELFTYAKEAVIALAKEFQEILLHRIPEEYQESLKESFRNRENLEAYKEELSILDKDIPLKVIFSLRTERFNYLTHLVNYIPTLLSNTYKIRRMTAMQVRAAITEPALVNDDGFASPPFTYKESIVQSLVDFLDADTKGEGGKIEVFEMQIICQRLEALLIEHLAKEPQPPATLPVLFKEAIITESPSIKDKQHPYAEIIKNYYKETIDTIAEPVEQLSARYLIEFKLIDSATDNRISLDNAFVKQTGISEAVLRHLIDRRIIRMEVNTVSGHSYEISHDSLVIPIRNATTELGDLQQKLSDFYEGAVESETRNGRSVRAIINEILLEEKDVKRTAVTELSADDIALLRTNPVIVEKPIKGTTSDTQTLAVKKIFQQTAQQSRVRSQQSSTRSWVRRFAIISFVFIGALVAFLFLFRISKQREHRLSSLLFLSVVDTIPNKREALELAHYIYQKDVLYNRDAPILKTKLLDILHTQQIQSLFSYLSISIPSANLKREEITLSPNGEFSIYHYKKNEGDAPSGRYFFCDKKGNILKQFDNILYAYFTNRSDVAILAKAAEGRDSIYSSTNKLAPAFVLFNSNTGAAETITLQPGQYLYAPDYAAAYAPVIANRRLVYFDAFGNLVAPVYSPAMRASSQQAQLIPVTMLRTVVNQTVAGNPAQVPARMPTRALENRVKQFMQDASRELIGTNLTKNEILYKNKSPRNGPETIWREHIADGKTLKSHPFEEGIQSAAYNEQADATLVYTKDNRLYLLDSMLHIKAGFQLTANDLYGFSEDGNRFFYVRNEAISFFDNSKALVNLFDYNQAVGWLQRQFTDEDKPSLQKLKKQYELNF